MENQECQQLSWHAVDGGWVFPQLHHLHRNIFRVAAQTANSFLFISLAGGCNLFADPANLAAGNRSTVRRLEEDTGSVLA
jgi:hypothetical protein